jgi:Fe-S cluster biogenesis protein NfuA
MLPSAAPVRVGPYDRPVDDLKERVGAKLDEMRPYLERSGGSIELLGVEDGLAQVNLWLTRPGPNRLVFSLQMKSGIERALKDAIPDLRGVEALNLPPHTLLGWDQPAFRPVDLPVDEAPPGS